MVDVIINKNHIGVEKMRSIALAVVSIGLMSSVALAGDAVLHKGNQTLKLNCDGTGCYSKTFVNGKASGGRVRLGPGGHENYVKWKAKYTAQGWR